MTARECVLKALYDIDVNGAYTNTALKNALRSEGLSVQDKGFVTELIYGIVANKTALDFIISKYSKIKLKKISPWVINILRMGLFQMFYMRALLKRILKKNTENNFLYRLNFRKNLSQKKTFRLCNKKQNFVVNMRKS